MSLAPSTNVILDENMLYKFFCRLVKDCIMEYEYIPICDEMYAKRDDVSIVFFQCLIAT